MTNKEKLLEIAARLEDYAPLIEHGGVTNPDQMLEDAKTLRVVAEDICPDGCDGG